MIKKQNGATPGGLEVPRSLVVKDMLKKARELPKEHQPLIPTGADIKWRYMWRIGPTPSTTRFKVHYINSYFILYPQSVF